MPNASTPLIRTPEYIAIRQGDVVGGLTFPERLIGDVQWLAASRMRIFPGSRVGGGIGVMIWNRS
jgi:hypothetical protein